MQGFKFLNCLLYHIFPGANASTSAKEDQMAADAETDSEPEEKPKKSGLDNFLGESYFLIFREVNFK